MGTVDIWFVNLGIKITDLQKSFSIGNFSIAYYGMILGSGVLFGLLVATIIAKKNGENPEVYLDLAIYGTIFGILCARTYYVAFSWDYYRNNLLEIFNLRGGGIAMYGSAIGAVLTVVVYSRIKKLNFGQLCDTASCGLITGQIVGRWGNFVNCEAFGGYTDNLLAMRLNVDKVHSYMISQELADKMITVDGVKYIQVHPTFLYESLWNLGVLIIMILFTKHKKWNGEVFCLYLIGYGIGRFWIEGLRTDQLQIGDTGIAISQVVALVTAAVGALLIVYNRRKKAAAKAASAEGNEKE
ncbi:MAG: prolipoprotein diacylglyceryl transferase [Lachnospiraceae bacterium]|nr:prolipoprotein diacylglyceryl transferase [Lachnospiraceae bacterium]